MDRPTVLYPIIVEGKYDKIKLQSLFEADVFVTDGFGVFSQSEKVMLFRKLAEKSPIIILTDSDGGGTVIRNFFKSAIPKDRLIHLYTPEVAGKERRKTSFSKAGTLGVEGLDGDILRELFSPFIAKEGTPCPKKGGITKADFYQFGLSGGEQSSCLREQLASQLGLPKKITANALLTALNILYTKDDFVHILANFSP